MILARYAYRSLFLPKGGRNFASTKLPIPDVKNLLLVSSAKGGVGKSTVSVNLALSLQRVLKTEPIGLLDADVFGPSIPIMMQLEGMKPEIDGKKRLIPLTSYGIKCMSIGFLVDPSSAVVWRGLMVMSAIRQLLREVAWGPLHTLVVDMPPGTGDVQLSICQNVPVQGTVIVTTPQQVALSDTRRGIEMLKKLNVPIYGIVENMSGFVCPACGHETDLFGHSKTDMADMSPNETLTGGAQLGESTNLELLTRIPISPQLTTSGDQGRPIVISFPESPISVIYDQLARQVLEKQCITADSKRVYKQNKINT